MAMGSPGGKEVGRLSIRVVADASGMRREIRREAQEIDDVTINVEADTTGFYEEIEAAREGASKTSASIDINAGVDNNKLRAKVKAAVEAAARGQRMDIPVYLNQATFHNGMYNLRSQMAQLTRERFTVRPEVAADSLRKARDDMQAAIDNLKINPMRVFSVGGSGDIDIFDSTKEEIARLEREFDGAKIRFDAEIDMADARREFYSTLASFEESANAFDLKLATNDQWMKDWERGLDRINVSMRQADQNHQNYLDMWDRRHKRAALSAEVFGRKLELALAGVAVSGIASGLALVGGYLGAGVVQAVALAGALSQIVGLAAVLPGLFAGGLASIGVLVLGFQGFGDALSALMDEDASPEDVAKALEKVSPAAGEAAKAVAGLKPAFRSLKEGIQESLFVGLDAGIARLETFANAMKPSLTAIGAGWNSVFTQMLGASADATVLSGFDTTFKNFGGMLTRLSAGIPAAARGFATLSAAGSQFFDSIGNYGAQQMREFEGWVGRITTDGSLERWVQNGKMAFSDLWAVVRNTGASLAAIFRVSGGQGILTDIRNISQEMRAFTESARGAETFQKIFFGAREIIKGVHDSLRPLGPMFTELVTGVGRFTSSFSASFGSAMAGGQTAMRQFMDMLVGLAPAMAGIIGGAVTGIGELAQQLAPSLQMLGNTLVPFIKELGEFAGGAGTVFLTSLTAILAVVNTLLGAVPGLSAALGGMFAVMAGASFIKKRADDFGIFGTNAGTAAGAADKAGGAMGRFGKAMSGLGKMLPAVAIAAGLYMIVDVVHQKLNPAFHELGDLASKLPGELSSINSQVSSGSISAAAAVKQHAAAWDQVTAAAGKAREEAENGFWEQLGRDIIGLGMADRIQQGSGTNGLGIAAARAASKAALDAEIAALTAATKAQATYNEAQIAATKAAEDFGVGSPQHVAALNALDAASRALAAAKAEEANATKTATQMMNEQTEASASLLGLQGDAAQAQLNVNAAMAGYNEAIATHGEGSQQATVALGKLSESILVAAQSAGAAAQAQAVATGTSDGLSESYAAQMAYLQPLIDAGGPAAEAAMAHAEALAWTSTKAVLAADDFDLLKGSIVAVPNSKEVVITADAYQANKTVIDTNYNVSVMPGGLIKITAKDEATQAAKNIVSGIGQMVASITVTTNYKPGPSGAAAGVAGGWSFRDGGYIDQGSHSRVDDVPAMLAKGEYVVNAATVKKLGVSFFDDLNFGDGASRTSGDITGKFADGGATSAWFDRAIQRSMSTGVRDIDLGSVAAPARGRGGNTFIMPDVDPVSIAREVDRINGFNSTLAEVL
jgi:hypothetical protein